MNEERGQAKESREPDLSERMAKTSDQWFSEADDKEAHANQLRRQELALRVEVVGLRSAAEGMRRAMAERAEYAEHVGTMLNQEQNQVAEASEDPHPLPRPKYAR